MPKYLIGLDEVGRGALAGPVFVSAVLIPKKLKIGNKKLGKIYDSKKLNPVKRFLWYKYLVNDLKIKFVVSKVSSKKIDEINISAAANLAAFKCIRRIIDQNNLKQKDFKILLDGGLYLKSKDFQEEFFSSAKTIIHGDKKYNVIKIASIIAKIKRDKFMENLDKKYPQYLFQKNKGYGTKLHLKLVKNYGPTPIHRLTFL
jgi:ribonuclease HII